MKKQWFILIGIIVMTFLVACNDDENAGENTQEKNSGEGSQNSDESTTIRWVMKDESHSNPVSDKFFQHLEEGLMEDQGVNVDIELVDVAGGNYSEQLSLLLNSGDIPDVIYFQGGDMSISQQGLLEDLTPYIESSEHVKDAMYAHNEARIENYPYLLWIKPLSQKIPVVRSDWFEQTETGTELLENPTIDNYHQFFNELVNLDTEDSPSYALTVAGDIAEINYIFDMAFGLNQTWMEDENGDYVYYRTTEQEKEKLKFYNKLYEDGLLDPEYITKAWDTKEDAFYNNEAAVITGTAGKVIDIYNGKMTQVNGEDASLQILPPAKGEFQGFGATDVSKESRGLAISSNSENKELAFEIFDYLASPEGQKLDRLGFEGKHYEVENEEINLTEKYYNEWYARFWEPSDYEPKMPLAQPLLSEPAQQSQTATKTYYNQDNSFIIPEKFISTWDATENYYREFATDAIMGRVSIEEGFDQYVQDWYEAGGDKVTKYANDNLE